MDEAPIQNIYPLSIFLISISAAILWNMGVLVYDGNLHDFQLTSHGLTAGEGLLATSGNIGVTAVGRRSKSPPLS